MYREPYGVEELIQERHMKRASIEFNRYYTVYIYMYVYIYVHTCIYFFLDTNMSSSTKQDSKMKQA